MADEQDTPLPNKDPKRRGRRRERSLQGTHLFREVRTDKLVWRRTHPLTGKRITRSTGFDVLELALAKAQEFEDAMNREAAGIKTYDGWTRELVPLVDEWMDDLRAQDHPPQEIWLKQKARLIRRALRELGLRRAADLTDVGRLDLRLKKLRKADSTLRRGYQDPLKQFSKWLAENGRFLERDPLLIWKTINYQAMERHRAFGPDEVARAFLMADWLDAHHRRPYPLRMIFTLLLVAGPRAGALVSRDVADFLPDEGRIDFGLGRGKKGRGHGKLDDRTLAELQAYLGDRDDGPLVLRQRGGRIGLMNLLRWWHEAFSLGVVWELWPRGEPWDVEVWHLVSQSLLTEETFVPMPGNPNTVKPETKLKRRALVERVKGFVEDLRAAWERRMHGVSLHAFRHTHQTWARSQGVDQVLINLQVGWTVSAGANDGVVLRSASTTGLSRYLDSRSKLLDARQSAIAVRKMLDEAMDALRTKRRGA